MGDLSLNFSRHEFKCKGNNCCGGSSPVHPDLIQGLQELRDMIGVPLIIVSGFRCVKHNKNVGGAEKSYHLYGMAADIKGVSLPLQELEIMVEQIHLFNKGGIGIYRNFIHVDVRNNKTRWRQ